MLELKGVAKEYKNIRKETINALSNINLSFNDKGLVFIKGKSGSGKSTLLNLISSQIVPDSGKIEIQGNDITMYTAGCLANYRKSTISLILQENNLISTLTVADNISLFSYNMSNEKKSTIVNDLLSKFGLDGMSSLYPYQLSIGEQQRVSCCRALYNDCAIILADEPTGSLDRKNAEKIISTLKNISKTKLVIIVSHNEKLIEKYGDRVITLEDGVIIDDKIINRTEKLEHSSSKLLKLPKRTIFKMAFKRLRPITFTLTIVLSSILIAFLSSYIYFGFSNDDLIVEKVNSTDLKYVSFRHPYGEPIGKDELKTITDNVDEDLYILVYEGFSIGNIRYDYAEYNEEWFEKNDYSFLCGKAPKLNEVVIPFEFTKEHLNNDEVCEMVNNEIEYEGKKIRISGVVDIPKTDNFYKLSNTVWVNMPDVINYYMENDLVSIDLDQMFHKRKNKVSLLEDKTFAKEDVIVKVSGWDFQDLADNQVVIGDSTGILTQDIENLVTYYKVFEDTQMSEEELYQLALKQVLEERNGRLFRNLYTGDKILDYDIVAVIKDVEDTIYTNEKVKQELLIHYKIGPIKISFFLNEDPQIREQLIDYFSSSEEIKRNYSSMLEFGEYSNIVEIMDLYDEFHEVYMDSFIVILTVLILLNVIMKISSFNYHKRDTYILKTLGAKNHEIALFLVIENIIVLIILLTVTTLSNIIIITKFISYTEFTNLLDILSFDLKYYMLNLIIVIFVSILPALGPIFFESTKNPKRLYDEVKL